jgi:TorA maturation chaperone TorD
MMLYFAGTMIMWDPENECIRDFWKEGILKSLPVSSSNPRFMKAAAQLRESVSDPGSGLDQMKRDYSSLFEASSSPAAPPSESGYRLKYNFVFENKNPVTRFYTDYGWRPKYGKSVPDDHIGIELLFLTLMVEKYLELDDEACHNEMRNELKRYISDHLVTWVPEWNTTIQEKALTLSYKGIGTLIVACIEDIYSIMEGRECSVADLSKN